MTIISTGACAAQSQRSPWLPEPDGAVAAEIGGLRVVVHPGTQGRYARFLVLRRPDSRAGHALLASGSEESAPAAMRAAERTAARISAARLG